MFALLNAELVDNRKGEGNVVDKKRVVAFNRGRKRVHNRIVDHGEIAQKSVGVFPGNFQINAFFVFARPLGMLLYGSAEAARFLRLLAPMVPFLYTDIVTDGCLKGLGQMMASMAFNIAEAALGLVLVWALLPRWALTGYLATLYICEVFNFTLSFLRLRQIINGDDSH